MKKRIMILIVIILFLTGCGNRTVKYDEVIDGAIVYYNEVRDKWYDGEGKIERGERDFMIWEDDDNYYVLILSEEHSKISGMYGCKVGKYNGRVSYNIDDEREIKELYDDNVEPVFIEENILLVETE